MFKKLLSKIIEQNKGRHSFPSAWCGTWVDKNNRSIVVELSDDVFYSVSVFDQDGNGYDIDLLDGTKIKTIHLPALFVEDSNAQSFLQVETGTKDIGPTYNLYFLFEDDNGNYRKANQSDPLDKLIVRPHVGLGLYDDFEDNLGVPWAYPLEDYKKINE